MILALVALPDCQARAKDRKTFDIRGLAKGPPEQLWLVDQEEPMPLPTRDAAARLLRLVRDEAHRFALAYSRKKARSKAVASVLDGIPGLGKVRRHILKRAFPQPRQILSASVSELAAIKGIGRKIAEQIHAFLHP